MYIPAKKLSLSGCDDSIDAEFKRLGGLGVEFTQGPMTAGDVKMAVFNDTCGNLIQLVEMIAEG